MAMANTFADRIVEFNRNLHYTGELPEGFQVMNPYLDNPETLQVMEQFYRKYYNDSEPRRFIRRNQPQQARCGSDPRAVYRYEAFGRGLRHSDDFGAYA